MPKADATQSFVQVKEVRDGIVILRDNSMRAILLASSINFALKSSDEQRAILHQFQSFLNTLDFSLQVYVQSRELDIRPYIIQLQERTTEQENELMQVQLREYIGFIESFTSEVDVMTKNFFVVVPYTPANAVQKGVSGLLGSTKKNTANTDQSRFEEHRMQIEQRIGVVSQGLNRIGVRTAVLGTEEVTELFYHLYNPNENNNALQL